MTGGVPHQKLKNDNFNCSRLPKRSTRAPFILLYYFLSILLTGQYPKQVFSISISMQDFALSSMSFVRSSSHDGEEAKL